MEGAKRGIIIDKNHVLGRVVTSVNCMQVNFTNHFIWGEKKAQIFRQTFHGTWCLQKSAACNGNAKYVWALDLVHMLSPSVTTYHTLLYECANEMRIILCLK